MSIPKRFPQNSWPHVRSVFQRPERIVCFLACLVFSVGFFVRSIYAETAEARALAAAKRFAPVYYEGVGPTPRGDYICAFDFDGDWKGDNNWAHCTDTQFPMKAYIYYSVEESASHFFIHYAAFHARDYKGGQLYGQLLSFGKDIYKKYKDKIGDIPGVQEAQLSHENDMEGCMIIAEKHGGDPARATLVGVETLAHDRFTPSSPDPTVASRLGRDNLIKIEEGTHPWVFIEPKGHGQHNYTGREKQIPTENAHIIYRYKGRADVPQGRREEDLSYDLVPIYSTLWKHAQISKPDDTFGEVYDYGVVEAMAYDSASRKSVLWRKEIGKVGAAFRGETEGKDKAKPPWGWLDLLEKSIKPGDWFFNPAPIVKQHYRFGENFSLSYLSNPFLGIRPSK